MTCQYFYYLRGRPIQDARTICPTAATRRAIQHPSTGHSIADMCSSLPYSAAVSSGHSQSAKTSAYRHCVVSIELSVGVFSSAFASTTLSNAWSCCEQYTLCHDPHRAGRGQPRLCQQRTPVFANMAPCTLRVSTALRLVRATCKLCRDRTPAGEGAVSALMSVLDIDACAVPVPDIAV
eukprot:97601-Rhodomonas_salina.2